MTIIEFLIHNNEKIPFKVTEYNQTLLAGTFDPACDINTLPLDILNKNVASLNLHFGLYTFAVKSDLTIDEFFNKKFNSI